MGTLDLVKDEVATKYGRNSFYELSLALSRTDQEIIVNEVAKRYAKAILEKAAQNAKVKSTLHDKGLNRSEIFVVDKESITSTELD